ncbi:MAG: hypothetical protein A3C30_04625 [Candidatus Levybacteria bacterium RIFCSPHIGHO2_02_FULL_40_18]|nr:MAG: hypothetical protein A2869_02280 [Candidatus Levybacteria bacterium RIFCSPHIGHO2_01_FULL_40_58]OGH26364.1 MAG: hypothetical protein A3C30_04625 [Candidatus Levybacteria bacterium RIFCSPHIGHO2_02_FULL_40_18]OGH31811.1 MAG: hypothetical protein A3E43_00420 [Candidatus Levybacteria bacterium RIFCSPHIGHO2_12_FULL_40_31]OGH40444.1 MAG: hypothetical protein A2894_00925 [Candidatus Levybacteria bacterium RIFCSPLOWO2_01_FULL_40_64]OGH49152.1 MAG: hypothetical protein A3I54_04325 [Candidatus Lev
MQLPFIKTIDKQKNFFLSLLIKPDKVGAILFEEINSKLFILSTNEIDAGEDTSKLSEEELLSAADKVISFVEGKLPEGAEVEKTIFSVPYYWVSEASGPEGLRPGGGKILQEYLDKLKKICKDLGLVPIGYIVSIEAIVAFLQKTEGAPVSGIFIEVTQNKVLLYVVRAGKVIEEKQSDIEESIIKTSEKLLQEVQSVDVLPSKIILLDYKDGSSVQQEFLSHQWAREIPFLHLPQVMMLERGFENEAIINGVATQMELEVLHDVTAGKAEALKEDLEYVEAKDFGFIKEGEDKEDKGEKRHEGESEDLKKVSKKSGKKEEEEPNISYFKEGEDLPAEIPKDEQDLPSKIKIPVSLDLIFSPIRNFRIPKGLPGPLKYKLIIVLFGVLLSAFFASFIYYNLVLRAEIKIMSDKKSIDKNQNVLFSRDSTEGTNINIEVAQETITGSEQKNSTGKKETGDRAKGEITLYNKTEQKKTFSKETIIIGPNDLEFELTEEVNIASTSPFSTSLSSAKGKVIASTFGKEYNLPSNTNFTIKGFSSAQFIGKNTDSISGGTKKETTVVSSEDLEELLSEVNEKLEREAIQKAQSSLSSEQEILSKALSSEVLERKYTKKEGEEAGSVGISAKIKYSIGRYKKSDIENVVESLSRPDIPGTYALVGSDSKVEITSIKIGKDNSAQALLKVNAVYTPQIEGEKLAESLKGKTQDAAEKQIKSIAGVTEVVITFKNNLPFMPLVLPNQGKNILIEEEY